jgi:glycosyltransferase involved in cell wall biosynthesis
MNISVVVPLYNEAESLPELVEWNCRVMQENGYSFEIILIDDGSNDESWEVIEQLKSKYPGVKGIKFRRNYGKSAALNIGFAEAQGDVVITMDADLQDSPDEIPELYRKITQEKYDLVSGWKKKRHDPLSKTLPTKLFNSATRSMSGIHNLHDFNCGLKAYRKDVVKNIEVYGEMHRYIPVLAKWAGFKKITEQEVEHRPRKYGTTKFGMSRFVNGFLDLLSIFFVGKFGKRPMHFFGTMGVLSFLTGLIMTIWLIADKLIAISQNLKYRNATDQPLFYIALVAIIVGFQLFLTGFVAELVSRNSTERNNYQKENGIDVQMGKCANEKITNAS